MREKAEKPAKRKLTRNQRKQIEAVIRQAKGDGKNHTVQDSIPFQNMFPDGLCRLEGGTFSKTIAFEDVNYRLAGPEDQRSIFESLCDFYNGYDPTIGVQVTLDSRSGGSAADEMFGITRQGNDLDPIRDEAVDILRMQYKRGNNGYVKTKYVTLTIEAENLPAARARFARIETDTLNRLKVMGAAAHVLDGKERLELLYNILHPEGGQFAFEWDWLPASGLSVKDFISPSSFHFGETRTFRIGRRYGAVSFLQILAPEMHDRNVIICDPEDEYSPLVKRLGGQVIRLSPSSTDYVNPLDINLNYSEEENPLALKSDFVLSFCELIMGSKTGLEAIEKTVIDRAVQMIYQPYFADPRPGNMPILGDLMNALLSQHIPEADRVAQALDLYVNGSLNFFNHRTTVDISNRLVCFDIKGLGKNLKKPGMLIVQDAVWNTVTINRAIGRSTWYFVDEFHLLLKEEQTAAYSAEIWKRFRKWGGIPTGATQNPKDLLSSPEIENILENSDFIYMLNQAAGDRKILAERLNISSEQLAYVTNSEPGHGLLFFNNVILPFADDFPKDTELYKLLTTKPSEVAHETVDDEKEDQNG